MTKTNQILMLWADELDRHYVSPQVLGTILLSPEDYKDVLDDFDKMGTSIIKEVSFGQGTDSPVKAGLCVTTGGYTWELKEAETSSILWTVLKQKV